MFSGYQMWSLVATGVSHYNGCELLFLLYGQFKKIKKAAMNEDSRGIFLFSDYVLSASCSLSLESGITG